MNDEFRHRTTGQTVMATGGFRFGECGAGSPYFVQGLVPGKPFVQVVFDASAFEREYERTGRREPDCAEWWRGR